MNLVSMNIVLILQRWRLKLSCCLGHNTRKDLTTDNGERAACLPLRCGGTEHLLTQQYRRLHAGSSMGLSTGEGRYARKPIA